MENFDKKLDEALATAGSGTVPPPVDYGEGEDGPEWQPTPEQQRIIWQWVAADQHRVRRPALKALAASGPKFTISHLKLHGLATPANQSVSGVVTLNGSWSLRVDGSGSDFTDTITSALVRTDLWHSLGIDPRNAYRASQSDAFLATVVSALQSALNRDNTAAFWLYDAEDVEQIVKNALDDALGRARLVVGSRGGEYAHKLRRLERTGKPQNNRSSLGTQSRLRDGVIVMHQPVLEVSASVGYEFGATVAVSARFGVPGAISLALSTAMDDVFSQLRDELEIVDSGEDVDWDPASFIGVSDVTDELADIEPATTAAVLEKLSPRYFATMAKDYSVRDHVCKLTPIKASLSSSGLVLEVGVECYSA